MLHPTHDPITDVSNAFHALRYRFGSDYTRIGYQWAVQQYAQPPHGMSVSDWFIDLDDAIEEASWHGEQAVVAVVHLWLVVNYPGPMAEIPRTEQLDFADGFVSFCEKAQVFGAG